MAGLLGARAALKLRAAIICVFVGAAVALPAAACINTFKTELMEARGTGEPGALAALVAEAEARYRESPTLENTNDLAVGWVLTGRQAEGIRLLRELEQRQPGNAVVAANLGTALELAGQDEEALNWIRESVRRDPDEHQGSEWVHVRILETKLALKRDPHWLRKNSVIGWREGQRLPPNERSQPRNPRDIVDAIRYQLEERQQFVSAPDPVMGDLYLTLGDLANAFPAVWRDTWRRDEEEAESYRLALYYGTPHEARARERQAAAEARVEAARPAKLAAAKKEQEVRERAARLQQNADELRAKQREEQKRRRWLGLGIFGGFLVIIAVVATIVPWHRRKEGEGPAGGNPG